MFKRLRRYLAFVHDNVHWPSSFIGSERHRFDQARDLVSTKIWPLGSPIEPGLLQCGVGRAFAEPLDKIIIDGPYNRLNASSGKNVWSEYWKTSPFFAASFA